MSMQIANQTESARILTRPYEPLPASTNGADVETPKAATAIADPDVRIGTLVSFEQSILR